jgi:TonB family protein
MWLPILVFSATGSAQVFPESAAVKWENYSVKTFKAAFLMPKLPVLSTENNRCRGEESFSYGSYAQGSAYVVRITRKVEVWESCGEDGKEFDKTNFEQRVSFLKSEPSPLRQRGSAKGKSDEIILEGNNRIYKLVNDFRNEQWFELMIVNPDESKPEFKKFLASLKISKKPKGIEIGEGAPQTLGDKLEQSFEETDGRKKTAVTPGSESSSKNTITEGVKVVLKPRANYTDMARSNLTQGKVVLRVTFRANGGIGAISVISGVADGLTEESIAAARRILFIPARRNGVAYSVTKPVEYTFTIY